MKILIRGDVWNVDLGKPYGSEQGYIRPCLILQNDIANEYSPIVAVLPLTHQTKDFNLTHVEVNNLDKKPSFILCEQIRAVDKTRIRNKVGKIDQLKMLEVEEKLNRHLGMGD